MNDYRELIEMLRDMSRAIIYDDSKELGIAEELITDVGANACNDAADTIEKLVEELEHYKSEIEITRKFIKDNDLVWELNNYCRRKKNV